MHPLFPCLAGLTLVSIADAASVTGQILDAATGQPLPARLYIQDTAGKWFFPQSAATNGSAIRYEKRNWINTNTVEMHTTLSAHPFRIALAPGVYVFTVERGVEYRTLTQRVEVTQAPTDLKLPLSRWINMAARGWYSGDTHVHRDPAELPNVMLAEDVNVTAPMVWWTTVDDVPPSRSPKNVKGDFPAAPVVIDPTHVYYPRNTEYEIFTTSKKTHTLGALLVVNHQSVLDRPSLPVGKVAERARAEGALLDLDKHNWPWSIAIAAIVKPDLYELANNHHWRTTFSITNWAEPAPAWMNVGNGSDNELNWTLYGFQTYYALLNCGLRLQPAAGTANGVHPVPLGFGRVYVQLTNGFSYDAWMKGLKDGRSFVTTGPMLELDPMSGKRLAIAGDRTNAEISGVVSSTHRVKSVEIVVNGGIVAATNRAPRTSLSGSHEETFRATVNLPGPSWVAVRCWEEREDGRIRFAHTAPIWIDAPGLPLRPRWQEIEWLAASVKEELARSRPLLPAAAVKEYEEALAFYERLRANARP